MTSIMSSEQAERQSAWPNAHWEAARGAASTTPTIPRAKRYKCQKRAT